jgi:hypothetical protein
VSVIPVAAFLIDFDAKAVTPDVAEETSQYVFGGVGDIQPIDPVEEAYARGLDEGRRASEIAAEARIEELKAAMDLSLAATRQAWCEEQGPQIAERITTAVRELEERVSQSVACVLRPFLAQAVREHAVGELRAVLQDLLNSTPEIALQVTGPEDLLAVVRASLPGLAAVTYVAGESVDVEVKAGASIIETRIATWLRETTGNSA